MNVLNVLMDNLHSIYGRPRRALGPEIDDSTLSFVNRGPPGFMIMLGPVLISVVEFLRFALRGLHY